MKNIGDLDLARIDTSPQDKPGQVLDDHANNKSYEYVQNNGDAAAVVDQFAVQHTDGVAGSATMGSDPLSDTVNGQMDCLGVWEAAVPVGSWGYVQKSGKRATLVGSVATAGTPCEVASAAFVGTAALAGQPFQYLGLDGTAVDLRM